MQQAQQQTADQAADRRQQRRERRPAQAPGLFPDRQQGRRAGPVEQGKKHHRASRPGRPALRAQQQAQLRGGGGLGERPRRAVDHQDHRKHDLVGRQAEQKAQQNRAVQAEEQPKGFQKRGKPRQQAALRQQPEQRARRGRHRRGAPEHEERPVEQRADEHLPELRHPVGRQLQQKGRGLPGQQRAAQERRHREAHDEAQRQERRRPQRSQKAPSRAAPASQKEARERDQRRKAAVAGRQRVGQHGDQPLALAGDDAAAGHARGVAAEAHHHG